MLPRKCERGTFSSRMRPTISDGYGKLLKSHLAPNMINYDNFTHPDPCVHSAMYCFTHILLVLIASLAMQCASAQQLVPSATVVADLVKETHEAERLANALRELAKKVDDYYWIGTMYNEVDVPAHICYSLGMLLGLEKYVRRLRFDRSLRPARNSEEAHARRVQAQSLDNFVMAVNATLKQSPSQRTIAWNLDCANKYGIALQEKGEPTFYEILDEGRGIKILGAIETGFTAKLRATLARAPKATFIALGSGGGSVAEAIDSGQLIRSKGLATTIWNNCYSACPLVFLGGVERHIHSPYPSLGFHQISTPGGAISTNSPVYAIVAAYIRSMGVNDQFVLSAMLSATPAQMNMVNGADTRLCDARIATWIQRACEAAR